MNQQGKKTLYWKIGVFTVICAGLALLFTWSEGTREHTVGVIVAVMIAVIALFSMFFIWMSNDRKA